MSDCCGREHFVIMKGRLTNELHDVTVGGVDDEECQGSGSVWVVFDPRLLYTIFSSITAFILRRTRISTCTAATHSAAAVNYRKLHMQELITIGVRNPVGKCKHSQIAA